MSREEWLTDLTERILDLRDEASMSGLYCVASHLDDAVSECAVPPEIELRYLLVMEDIHGEALSHSKVEIFPANKVKRLVLD